MEETNQTTPQTNAEASLSTPAPKSTGASYAVPVAILLGFGMIAFAIYSSGTNAPAVAQPTAQDEPIQEVAPVPEVNADDHIVGNPNAPIVVVEYSDFDCPFCKRFHETMQTVMDQYGPDGKVAWVYRHFPIDKLHPSASHIAIASECVAKFGGNEAFWSFSDQVFGERGTNELTDTTRLTEFATTAGVDADEFNACLTAEDTKAEVDNDLTEGINAGVTGTPFSFIMIAGQQLPVNGAQPLEYMTANIDNLLEQLETAENPQ